MLWVLWFSVRWSCKEQGLDSMTLMVPSGVNLWNCSTVSSQWSLSTVFHQNSFPSYFLLETLIQWHQDALWEHINATKANSRSQTSAWPPCLLPSWLPLWDSWAPALQPAAHLIFLYSIVVLFILHFPPYISIFIFYIQRSYSIKKSPVAHQNIRCQIKVQVTQWE